MKDYAPRIRLSKAEHDAILKLRTVNNVLVVGDIHEPFCLDGYLDFCKEQYNRFNCNKVVCMPIAKLLVVPLKHDVIQCK